MRLIEADRSTGWMGIIAGLVLLVWSMPTLWSFAFEGSAQFVIKNVRLFGGDAALAAGVLAAFGAVMLVVGAVVLFRDRRGA